MVVEESAQVEEASGASASSWALGELEWWMEKKGEMSLNWI